MNRRSFIQVATAALAAIGIKPNVARAEKSSPAIAPPKQKWVEITPQIDCSAFGLRAKVPIYSLEEQTDNGLRPRYDFGKPDPVYYSQGMRTHRITVVVPVFAVPAGMDSTLADIFHDAPPSRCIAETMDFLPCGDARATLTYQILATPQPSQTITIRRL